MEGCDFFNSKTTKSFLTKPEAMNYLMSNDADWDWYIEAVLAAALTQKDDSLQAKYLKSELAHTLAQQGEPVAYMAKNKNGGTESLIRARLLEQIGRSDDHDYTPLYAGVAPAPVEQRCTYCDGTGDVHSIDGEWRGTCHCAAAPAPQPVHQGERAELVEAFGKLYKKYVNLLESGRDRILDLGGSCDPVDVMEMSDPELRDARTALSKYKGAK